MACKRSPVRIRYPPQRRGRIERCGPVLVLGGWGGNWVYRAGVLVGGGKAGGGGWTSVRNVNPARVWAGMGILANVNKKEPTRPCQHPCIRMPVCPAADLFCPPGIHYQVFHSGVFHFDDLSNIRFPKIFLVGQGRLAGYVCQVAPGCFLPFRAFGPGGWN